ncbi:uncharacterized protein LOC144141731 [Haemaphysalis longicornis]
MMTTLLPSPASSEEMTAAASAPFYGHVPWMTTPSASLPGCYTSHEATDFKPETPSPDNSSSWDPNFPARHSSAASSIPAGNTIGNIGSAGTCSNQSATGEVSSSSPTSCNANKHIPHREKPPHMVARRNARERRRVEAVNSAFSRLRKCVPVENRAKRLSKAKTLHKAIEYIYALQRLLDEADKTATVPATSSQLDEQGDEADLNKRPDATASPEKENGFTDRPRMVNVDHVHYATENYQSFFNFYEQCPSTFVA